MGRRPLNLTAILSLCAALSACGGNRTVPNPNLTPTTVEVVVMVPYDCGVPPAIDPVKMRDVVFEPVEAEGIKYFGLTAEQYQFLGMNTSDWLAASKQMKAQRNHYRDCITRSQQGGQNEDLDFSLDNNFSTDRTE